MRNESERDEPKGKNIFLFVRKKKNPISYTSIFLSTCNALAGASLIKLADHVSLRVKIKVIGNYGHLRDTLCALDVKY